MGHGVWVMDQGAWSMEEKIQDFSQAKFRVTGAGI